MRRKQRSNRPEREIFENLEDWWELDGVEVRPDESQLIDQTFMAWDAYCRHSVKLEQLLQAYLDLPRVYQSEELNQSVNRHYQATMQYLWLFCGIEADDVQRLRTVYSVVRQVEQLFVRQLERRFPTADMSLEPKSQLFDRLADGLVDAPDESVDQCQRVWRAADAEYRRITNERFSQVELLFDSYRV